MGIYLKKNSMDFQLTKYTILLRESQGYSLLFLDKKKRDQQDIVDCIVIKNLEK